MKTTLFALLAMLRALKWCNECDGGVMVWETSMSQTNNHNITTPFLTIPVAPKEENDKKRQKRSWVIVI
jgi:hypothetical protein